MHTYKAIGVREGLECVCVRCTAVICVAVIINVLIALSSNFVNVCVRNAHEIHSTCRLMRAHTLSLSLEEGMEKIVGKQRR